ncbi:MAG: hypothetical protein EHM36_14330, partial [Deltaproteobacteria bacterium]
NGYLSFFNAHKNRETMIYVGANDGMLHAFKVGDGREIFSIVPKNLLGELKNLKSMHDIYVDSSPKAGDVYFPGQSKWKTIIVTGERAGGPYYFAVDVTEPLNSEYPKILWEWTDPNMGEAWAKPEIGKVKVGGDTKFVAFITGGYSASNNKSNCFYVVDIETGKTLKEWYNLGSSSNKIPSGATSFESGADGYTTSVYFGDTDGNIWRADLKNADKANWTCTVFFTPEAAKRKPIYYPPAVVRNDLNKVLVLFGSGDEMNLKNPGSFYIWEIEETETGSQLNWFKELTDEKVLGQPVVANHVVYFTTWKYTGGTENCGAGQGNLYGLALSSSAGVGGAAALVLLDSTKTPMTAKQSITLGPGVPTKPVVTNGVIYISSSVNSRGYYEYPGSGDSASGMGPGGIKFPGWPTSRVRSWREVF